MAAAPADFRAGRAGRGQAQARGGARPPAGADRGHPRRAHREPRRRPDDRRLRRRARGEAAERARGKLERKGADLIVLNDVSDPRSDSRAIDNAVTLIDADSETEVPIDSKDAIAEAILDEVDQLRLAVDASQPAQPG